MIFYLEKVAKWGDYGWYSPCPDIYAKHFRTREVPEWGRTVECMLGVLRKGWGTTEGNSSGLSSDGKDLRGSLKRLAQGLMSSESPVKDKDLWDRNKEIVIWDFECHPQITSTIVLTVFESRFILLLCFQLCGSEKAISWWIWVTFLLPAHIGRD